MKPRGLVAIGHGNFLNPSQVVVVLNPNTMAVRRLKEAARDGSRLLDATHGKRTRAVIVTESGHVVLSSNTPETLSGRLADFGIDHEE